ncbi:MAG TPA: hypothetical protein VHB30_03190 [Solirubrobacteraceae bacterium]|jgi:hypothetical protein|nr:hypothetical protein [Solirubrobacteraceae bacterium]
MNDAMTSPVLTRRVLIGLAAWTLACFALSGILGNHHHGLRQTVADISWTGLWIGALLLIVSVAFVLIRSRARRGRA